MKKIEVFVQYVGQRMLCAVKKAVSVRKCATKIVKMIRHAFNN